MKIRKIRLLGYKRFYDLTIDLGENPTRIVALVGPNGCGKSSVLDGLLYQNQGGFIGTGGDKSADYHILKSSQISGNDHVIVELDERSFREVQNSRSNNGTSNSMISFRSPYRYNSNLKVPGTNILQPIILNNDGASFTNMIDSRIDISYRRLFKKFNDYMWQHNLRPSDTMEKILGDLNKSLKNCLDLEITNIGNIEAGKGTLYFKKSDYIEEFEFNVLSAGEKEIVDLLIDLYIRQEDYTDTIFLFDEPELHINASIQRNLLLEIDRLIGENCQIIIATHSIGFLRALQNELRGNSQVVYFKKGTNWASAPQVLTPIKHTFANWNEIFETAIDDIAGLISPRTIIYCEGRDAPGAGGRERGLDANVFNNIFNEFFYDALFVSSGGNTELDQRSNIAFAILSKVFHDLEILILKDRDVSSGAPTTQAQRKIYLDTNPKTHRMLMRREIENYLYDKEVLSKYCGDNDLKFDEAEYDRFVTDINDQNLKDDTNRIKKICGIDTSLNPESFKFLLSSYIIRGTKVYAELKSCIFYR